VQAKLKVCIKSRPGFIRIGSLKYLRGFSAMTKKHLVSLKDSVVIITVLLLGACSPASQITPTTSIKLTQIPESTKTITLSPTGGLLPTRPLVATWSPSLVPFPIWTPLPTLSDPEAEVQLLSWLRGAPNCRLPCWAGITPGETEWQEAKQILGTAVSLEIVDENRGCDFGPCNILGWRSRSGLDFHGSVRSQLDNSIYGLAIFGYPPSSVLRLDKVLSIYGLPGKVFLGAHNSITPPDNIYIRITLAYPNNQFIIHFGWMGSLSGDAMVGCLQNEHIDLYIHPITGPWTDDAIRLLINNTGLTAADDFRPLENATGLTIDQFYNIFVKGDGDKCISTPVTLWQ
jgi:hypothetical protein